MAVLRDYKCLEHGLFESFEQACPESGCTCEISVAFLKPVGTKSAKTIGFDNAIRMQADAFGMTNLRSAREGDNQLGYLPNPTGGSAEPPPGSGVFWGGVPQDFTVAPAMQGLTVENVVKGRALDAEGSPQLQEMGFASLKARTKIQADDPKLRVPQSVIDQARRESALEEKSLAEARGEALSQLP